MHAYYWLFLLYNQLAPVLLRIAQPIAIMIGMPMADMPSIRPYEITFNQYRILSLLIYKFPLN